MYFNYIVFPDEILSPLNDCWYKRKGAIKYTC